MLKLEKKLKELGLLKGPANRAFDARTKAAVQKVENAHGWKADGVVGNRVWRKVMTDGFTMPVAPNPPAGSDKDFSFTTVNINVKSNPEMPQASVVHDIRRAAKQGGIIGWQEIGPKRYADAIRALGPKWGHFFPKDGKLRIPNPISWNKEVWKKVDGGFERTHNGMAKVSPHRYVTWVKLKHRETGKTIVRMNTHLVSGAWSSPKKTTAWRREMWRKHMAEMKLMVAKFKKQGNIVVLGGDFNRDSFRLFGNDVVYDNKLNVGTHGKSTLDYVMHVPNKDLKKKSVRVQGGYRSDHDAVVVKYEVDA